MKIKLGPKTIKIRLAHFLHPIQSVKSLYKTAKGLLLFYIYKPQIESKIKRGIRKQCWCGGKLLPFKYHKSYAICSECNCYVNIYPPQNLNELYSLNWYWHIIQQIYGYPTIKERAELYKKDGRLDYWLKLIQTYAPKEGVVIEIGCAPGILLQRLQSLGYSCIGVEPDEETAVWIRNNLNVDVRSGLFPEINLPSCDLFLAFDVLEHSPQPDKFMQKVAELLRPGGIAIIQTPIERYNYDPPFGDAFDSAFKDMEHLFLFTDKAIQKLADMVGLEILSKNERFSLGHEICVFFKN